MDTEDVDNMDSNQTQETVEDMRNNHEQVFREPHGFKALIKTEQIFKQEIEESPEYQTNELHEGLEYNSVNEIKDPLQCEINASIENKPMDTVHEQLKGTDLPLEDFSLKYCLLCQLQRLDPDGPKAVIPKVRPRPFEP